LSLGLIFSKMMEIKKMNLVKKLCTGLFATALLVSAGAQAQTISVKVTFPKGSAGETLTAKPSTPFSPCRTDTIDAASFSVTYKMATGTTAATAPPVYVFLRNHQTGAMFAVSKGPLGTTTTAQVAQVTLRTLGAHTSTTATLAIAPADPVPVGFVAYNPADPRHFLADNPAFDADVDDPFAYVIPSFVPRSRFINGDQTEDIFGGITSLNGVTTGTWQLIGIIPTATSIGAPGTFSLNNPATWAAFDVATFVLGAPWPVANCGSI
jgi:hypothetical protein